MKMLCQSSWSPGQNPKPRPLIHETAVLSPYSTATFSFFQKISDKNFDVFLVSSLSVGCTPIFSTTLFTKGEVKIVNFLNMYFYSAISYFRFFRR
jgi:hypothetical protein